MRYSNRSEAGEILAGLLADLDLEDPVVLGLPRGGVVVAAPVAEHLEAPLDVLVVRKLGVPWHPELGMGAIAEGEVVLVNRDLMERVGVTDRELERVERREREEMERRARLYRQGSAPAVVEGHTALIVDDGLATGFTARAAIAAARRRNATSVILAVPVGAPSTVQDLEALADRVVCPTQPSNLGAVGAWYRDFEQVEDAEVIELLRRAAGRASP